MTDTNERQQLSPGTATDAGFAETFSQAAADAQGKMRILVADGNATIRKLLRLGLSDEAYEIVEATNGPDAYRIATATPEPHAILLDAGLSGGMDGLKVCRDLKSDMQFRTIPIVMLTTTGSNEEINEAVDAGADEFLSKPINRGELKVRLRSITRLHKGNAELIGAESVALSLARAVASKDGYSSGHVEQAANLAVDFGKALGLDAAELKMLRYGAILHNVGKIAIPDSILEKLVVYQVHQCERDVRQDDDDKEAKATSDTQHGANDTNAEVSEDEFF